MENIFYSGNKQRMKNKAKRYQYIIKFFLTDIKESFKITKIQNAVLSQAPEIFKVDTNRKPFQIKKNQNRQFNDLLKDLKGWKLIHSSPTKSTRGGVETEDYCLTNLGITIGLMID